VKLAPDWLADSDIKHLLRACERAGIVLRFVGGAVRDTVLLREVRDIDAATPTPAQEVMERLGAQGLKLIPTGIDHGTVTVVLAGRQVEITTLRRDVKTDGRWAVVAYTENWEEDAARRDFTMNALYLTPDGELFDYFQGVEDALAGRVRFIGDAAARIKEDGLRILRFFRFFATHGEPPADTGALTACRIHAARIEPLSGERIGQEMKKLLSAQNPVPALRLMEEAGVSHYVFGEGERSCNLLIRLLMLEHTTSHAASCWARLAALLPQSEEGEEALAIAARWKLSRREEKQLRWLQTAPRLDARSPRHAHTRVLRLQGAEWYRDLLLLSAAGARGWDIMPWFSVAETFVLPVFPVTGGDLTARGISPGPELGKRLAQLEEAWEMSDYTLDKDALLAMTSD
jgi:poly(A) polymerase